MNSTLHFLRLYSRPFPSTSYKEGHLCSIAKRLHTIQKVGKALYAQRNQFVVSVVPYSSNAEKG